MILVTGSAGYIGSEICSNFERLKIKYIGIDNLKYSYKINVSNNRNFKKCCISNEKKISHFIKKFNIKTVIHAAAYAYVIDSEKNKKKYYNNNVLKTKKFISIIKKNKVDNFIFFSSSNVYSEKNKTGIFTEKSKTKPKNFYGKTKLNIESFTIKKNFNNLIILRLFNIIGMTKKFKPKNFGNFKYQRLLFKMIYNYKKKTPVFINYIKKVSKIIYPSRDFVDIRDLNKLILKIIKSLKKFNNHKVYNVGSGKSVKLNKILKIFKNSVNFKVKTVYKEIYKNEYINTKSSIEKVKKDYKWRPVINIKSSIDSYKNKLII